MRPTWLMLFVHIAVELLLQSSVLRPHWLLHYCESGLLCYLNGRHMRIVRSSARSRHWAIWHNNSWCHVAPKFQSDVCKWLPVRWAHADHEPCSLRWLRFSRHLYQLRDTQIELWFRFRCRRSANPTTICWQWFFTDHNQGPVWLLIL
jgi:hypothetical protein